ncbi:putative zinc finger protein [Rosellinia necatrix]|uniref:Putative zinc finger protein n=1 Tax=Rosellinia necatrix TaxID=77044 RepID=A0A1S8A5A7_ROSNE|nr:putative zinc finger protein [Rosellinia necatrix]
MTSEWKPTFHIHWKYYHRDSFPEIRDSFKTQGLTLRELFVDHNSQASYQVMTDMSNRVNNHLQNYQDDRQDLEEHIRRYQMDRDVFLDQARKAEEHRQQGRLDDVRKWLSSTGVPQSELHTKFAETRKQHPDTTDWILKDDKVRDWIHQPAAGAPSFLCVTGKTGAGKTILASRIIDYCERKRRGFKTSFFYCREDDMAQHACLAIYKHLLLQMLQHYPDLLPSCHDKKSKSSPVSIDESEAKTLIRLFCDTDMNQFIIIDGVDEVPAGELKQLLNFFTAVVDRSDKRTFGKVRVMFIGRDHADFKQLKSAQIVPLNEKSLAEAIKIYAAKKARELKEVLGLKDDLLWRTQALIIAHSDGMFLLASLVMDELLRQPTIEHLENQLQGDFFPKGLHDAYNKIVNRLQRELVANQWLIAKRIIGWLACAKRPLTWHEIQAALSMVFDDSDEYQNSVTMDYYRKQLRCDIRLICGSLVWKIGNRIMFAHSTVKEYIVKTDHIKLSLIEYDFSTTCLRYLASPCFQKDLPEDTRETYVREGYYVFQYYALAKWGHHLSAVVEAQPDQYMGDLSCFSRAVVNFAKVYRRELSGPIDVTRGDPQAREKCSRFANEGFYDDLVTIWTHFRYHQLADIKIRNKISLPTLETSWEETDRVLKTLSVNEDVKDLYGDGLFKCNRLECDFFYEGFEAEDAREKHDEKHNRPYSCPIDSCSTGSFGFSSEKERKKHIRNCHSEEEFGNPTFPSQREEAAEERAHICKQCGQRLSRAANRRDHEDSHRGVRNHQCPICPKRFVWAGDRNRHVNVVHKEGRRLQAGSRNGG